MREDEVFVEYLKTRMDEELTSFLDRIGDEYSDSEEVFTTTVDQLSEEQSVPGENIGLAWLDVVCQECLEDYAGKKRCLSCNRHSCVTCLCGSTA